MPADIRLYFEGDKSLKPGFEAFLKDLREHARDQRCEFRLISAKSGEQARQDFEDAQETHPDAWSILLIDSEGPLKRRSGSQAARTFWMVEMMESWFHADKDRLVEFYRDGFRRTSLKANPDVEEIPKADLLKGLKAATRNCQKGVYNKTSHAPTLLGKIRPDLVRRAAPNCERLFQAVLKHLH